MRTLASTFSTRTDAEAASRRLEAIGVPRDRIILADVPKGEAAAGAPAGSVFITVKVTTDQVAAANEVLKSHRTESAPSSASSLRDPVNEAADKGRVEARVLPRPPLRGHEESRRLSDDIAPQNQQHERSVASSDQGWFRRYFLYSCIAVVAAFIMGAGLGLVS